MSEKAAGPRLVLSNPKDGTARTIILTSQQMSVFRGKRIGDEVDASVLGLGAGRIRITGGSNIAGIPMRPDVSGGRLVGVILTRGIGFHARRKPPSKRKKDRNRRPVKGLRKRVTVHGNVLSDDIIQINAVLVA
ncbi:MAG: S6e family ribosomal protein [Nitrososphaerota archaeon]|nr:S6e family ribosomal protein [Nitrososphaerota archaeon]